MIKKLILILSFTLAVLPSFAFAHSITGEPPGFWYTRLISDSNFLNKDSLDGASINGFLAGKGSWLANYTVPEYVDVPYFCRNASGNPETRSVSVHQIYSGYQIAGLTVGDLLAQRAQANGINPQVMLVLLERESSAISRSAPSSDITRAWPLFYSFDETMASYGYTCDGGVAQQKAVDFGGVGQQIAFGTFGTKKMYNDSTDWQSQIVIDGIGFYPESRATRALYRYTPHIHAGNHNFWYFYTVWFSNILYQPTNNFRVIKASSSSIYLQDVTNNTRYYIESESALNAWGFNFGSLAYLTDGEINTIPEYPAHITRLIKGSGPEVFYMENGHRHHIRSEGMFGMYGLSWGELSTLPNILVDQVPYGPSIGLLVRGGGDPSVYMLSNYRRWYIDNQFVMNAWGFGWPDIDRIPDSVTYPYIQANLEIIAKGRASPQVYAMTGGRRHYIPSADVFNNFGFNWGKLAVIGEETKSAFPEGKVLSRVVKGSAPHVYLIENSKKRYVSSTQALKRAGFDINQLVEISDSLLNVYPLGAPLN